MLRPDNPRARRGEKVAGQILASIADRDWKPGDYLGSIDELCRQYAAGPAILREAVRQLEQNGICVMRRGNKGGLFIARKPAGVAARALSTYLLLADAEVQDLAQIGWIMTESSHPRIAARLTADSAKEWRSIVTNIGRPDVTPVETLEYFLQYSGHAARLIGNSLLEVVHNSLFETLALHLTVKPGPEEHLQRRHYSASRKAIVEALIVGDIVTAGIIERETRQHSLSQLILAAETRRRAALSSDGLHIAAEVYDRLDEFGGQKQSHLLALAIARNIAAMDWPEGHPLGREPELMARFNVSRAIFREAIRILELHGVVRTKVGRNGGMVVGSPSPSYAIRTTMTCLEPIAISRADFRETQLVLFPALLMGHSPLEGAELQAIGKALRSATEAKAQIRIIDVVRIADKVRPQPVIRFLHEMLEAVSEWLGNGTHLAPQPLLDLIEALEAADAKLALLALRSAVP